MPNKRSTFVATTIVVVLVLALASGCASTGPSAKNRVLVVGDSLVEGNALTIATGLHNAGWSPVVDGRSGWSIGKWTSIISDVVQEARPRVAVVVLGTNDCAPRCRNVPDGIEQIMETLTDAGVQRVFWLNVQEQPSYPAGAEQVNASLADAASRWPQLTIVDLSGTLGGNQSLHISDGVHFNAAGGLAFTKLIVDSIQGA